MNKKQLKIVREHANRMWNMRFMGLKWQEIHQKRWDEDTKCPDDTCDCESIYYEKKDMPLFDGVNNATK